MTHHRHHHRQNTNTTVIVGPSVGYGLLSYWNSTPVYGSYTRTRWSFIAVILVVLVFIIFLVVSLVRKKLKHSNNNSQVSTNTKKPIVNI